jgi:CheY-like chemotaxis protein
VSRRKLLLADDSVTIQKVVNLTFADEGIEVIAVSDGNEAVDRLMEIAPDLVMADVNMPGLSGYQVCERIRQTEKFKNTPVILLVGSFEPFDEEEARRVGADDYLTKPFQSIRQLVSKVSDLLREAENGDRQSASGTGSFDDTQEMDVAPPTEEYYSVPTSSSSSSAAAATETESYEKAPATFDSSSGEASQYVDAGMDDEMIETSRSDSDSTSAAAAAAGIHSFDEAQKFGAPVHHEPDVQSDDDFAKTQPLSAADWREINESNEESQPTEITAAVSAAEAGYETASASEDEFYASGNLQQQQQQQTPPVETYQETTPFNQQQQLSSAENFAAAVAITPNEARPAKLTAVEYYDDEEDDLLELFDEDEFEEELATETPAAPPVEMRPNEEFSIRQTAPFEERRGQSSETVQTVEDETQAKAAAAFSSGSSSSGSQLSPELIDAIAQRVIEKLSDRTVKEIAWEVVPQQADLIIKKMVEEKLKE